MQIGGAGMSGGVAGQRLSFLNRIFLQSLPLINIAWSLIHSFTLINFGAQAHFPATKHIFIRI